MRRGGFDFLLIVQKSQDIQTETVTPGVTIFNERRGWQVLSFEDESYRFNFTECKICFVAAYKSFRNENSVAIESFHDYLLSLGCTFFMKYH